jgi:putative transposase
MRTQQWSDEQIIGLLQQADRGETTITALCRTHGISENTFYKWRQKYGGLQVNEAKRLRELEQENARLKKLLAEAMLDNAMLKEVVAKK